jgi:hypothetical protein
MVHNVYHELFLHSEQEAVEFVNMLVPVPLPGGDFFPPKLPSVDELAATWKGGKLCTWDSGG